MSEPSPQAIIPCLHYIRSLPLKHEGDCHFAGITPNGAIYVNEIYGDEDWMARYAFRLDGTLTAFSDENNGNSDLLALPSELTKPTSVRPAHPLHFSGARWRGMRDEDRIQDVVYPLLIAEKIALSGILNLPPPRLIGLAESVVLAEVLLVKPGLFVICRRLRFAHMLPSEQRDENQLPYDYDTKTLHVAHFYDAAAADEPDLIESIKAFPGTRLNRPMDCMVWQNWLLIADGAIEGHTAAVHLWQIGDHATAQNDTP